MNVKISHIKMIILEIGEAIIRIGDIEEHIIQDEANNQVLTIHTTADDKDIRVVLSLLGYIEYYDREIEVEDILNLGTLYMYILNNLISLWDYRYEKPFKVQYNGTRFSMYPFLYVNKIENLHHDDLILILLYGQFMRVLSSIRELVSKIYMCEDRSIIRLFRIVQYILNNTTQNQLKGLYVRAYMILPSAAPYQGDRDLLLEYMPSGNTTKWLSNMRSQQYALEAALKDPIIRVLYNKRLLDNAIIAGGSISSLILKGVLLPDSDIDIFIYGNNKDRTIRLIMNQIILVYGRDTSIGVSGSVIHISKDGMRPIQIISSSGKYADDILFNFDLTHICVGLDNRGFMGTPAFFYWTTKDTVYNKNIITAPIRYILRQFRIDKAEQRGFSIDNMNRSFIKKNSSNPPSLKITNVSSENEAISLVEKDGKFRNDLESEYHSSIHSLSLGVVTIVEVVYSLDIDRKFTSPTSVIYKTADGDIRLLNNLLVKGISWEKQHKEIPPSIIVLDGDLLLAQEQIQIGETYEIINTPSSITLVKRRCVGIALNE